MAGESFVRPRDGFRFKFGGMKVNSAPDTLPPDKYPYAQNIRALTDSSIQTRPGQVLKFTTAGGKPITDLRAYAALGTDDNPRVLVRDNADGVYLDSGVLVGTLAGGGASPGASMIPFRPNQSPNPYMYVANGSDYQKFSAPSASNTVVARKVGIVEPQAPPDAIPNVPLANAAIHKAADWGAGGTAGGPSDSARVSDTVHAVIFDPLSTGTFCTIQVGSSIGIQRQMLLTIGATSNQFIVRDVFAQVTTPIGIASIFYYAGSTGKCVIVPNNLSAQRGVHHKSIYDAEVLASLRRGALILLSGGSETCYVQSVTEGPDGSVAIETSTVSTHTAAETFTIPPAAALEQIAGSTTASVGAAVAANGVAYSVTTGIGTETATVTGLFVSGNAAFQPDDYLSFAVNVDNLLNLTEVKILFDVNDGTFNFDYYYYTVRPSDFANAVANTQAQIAALQAVVQRAAIDELTGNLDRNVGQVFSSHQTSTGQAQWTQILIPLSQLTRVGDTQNQALQNLTKIRFLWNATGTINVKHDSAIIVFGGSQPDVGDVGAPYQYRLRPRSSATGAIGNPSPATRYGVNPRRQSVTVTVPTTYVDPQADTWDIYRYGGAVTSWRFVGSVAIGTATFTDLFGDDAASSGDELEFDNFEPWPSIDLPLNVTATQVVGLTALVTIPSPTNALRFLPGNLVRIAGQNVYTLWTRPTLVAAPSTYLFQFQENAGTQTNVAVQIYEPAIARQFLPYMWGPDVSGTVFAVGDPLRPGTLYFAKNYAPDNAPDAYNIEMVQPSEPLMGGDVLDGLSLVGSTERWWALYPQPDNPSQRYNPVQMPMKRGLAAPFGHCTDGIRLFYWAKDGIRAGGSSGDESLTDADLYNLFPHEGILGKSVVYGTPPLGHVIQPPDYSRAGTFRLSIVNYYLYAVYQDATGATNVLVYDTRRNAWSFDLYPLAVTVLYHPEQQAGTLLTPTTRYPEALLADATGRVTVQTDGVNDVAAPIPCRIAVAEFDGGDIRAPKQWGDFFVDAATPSGLSVQPMSIANAVGTPTALAVNAARARQPVSVGGLVVSDFLGMLLTWTDDFTSQGGPTVLHAWQPSFDVQPASAIAWQTLGTSFGLEGYGHIRQIAVAWISTAPITLTPTTFDGQSPAPITIPSSGGAYKKQLFPLTANKGQLFTFKASSAAPFQFFLPDWEVYVGGWARSGAYAVVKSLSGEPVVSAVM